LCVDTLLGIVLAVVGLIVLCILVWMIASLAVSFSWPLAFIAVCCVATMTVCAAMLIEGFR